ncbi:formimidoylglutamate deiminase [Ktedonosporobacter rubrisoli]|uniref:Formimidoylglutamate deiminase n=1 Tax=Ktedonosporobacter rubrisoli TaxID=2509675 RepID=A0A4P6K317_KTERU|nr:formimidoylglutamate deiminase [Ktedonosporobacter rubrisoli]QBD82332.1 formimidoylglutamate deiminase [Ktedonosporobacter rubrisoli]
MQQLAPDYIYTPQGLQANMVVSISDEGYIVSVTRRDALSEEQAQQSIDALTGVALLPGFVNVHSHVFQRTLRGHTHRPLSQKDTFWTWRNAMYAAAQQLTPDQLYETALSTYREMLAAGYTSVGEFHYVHHQPGGQPYEHPNAMSEAILRAGQDAGIHVVLLMTAYAQAGFNRPPEEAQRRFCDSSVEAFLARVEALRSTGALVGIAPHSVRAVPELWFQAITDYCRLHHLPLHVHADEQRAEIEQCKAAYGCTPIEFLARCGTLGPMTTIVHATHANEQELALLAQFGCTVCVCPTTEGDLGDGIAPYAELVAAHIPLAIGSDSNTRLDPLEELRWAEYSARMRYQRRRVLIADEMGAPGPLLLDYGTSRGAAALGLQAGVIAPGMLADFVAIDLRHPMLAGWSEQDLLDVLFFGASPAVIEQVWVQGRKVVYRKSH